MHRKNKATDNHYTDTFELIHVSVHLFAHPLLMAYSDCTGTGPGLVQEM